MNNNESVRELRENRYRHYQRRLRALKNEIRDATENSYNIIENNNQAFRSIQSPGSSSDFKLSEDVKKLLRVGSEENFEGSQSNF